MSFRMCCDCLVRATDRMTWAQKKSARLPEDGSRKIEVKRLEMNMVYGDYMDYMYRKHLRWCRFTVIIVFHLASFAPDHSHRLECKWKRWHSLLLYFFLYGLSAEVDKNYATESVRWRWLFRLFCENIVSAPRHLAPSALLCSGMVYHWFRKWINVIELDREAKNH